MKKIIFNTTLLFLTFFFALVIILSTIGIETNKFNKLISEKLSKNKNIFLNFKTIRFKIDPKEMSLFLETNNPKISYANILIPAQNIKAYINFSSLLEINPKIEKINLVLEELDISQLNKLSPIIKPSNLKSILNNRIKKGKLISEIEFFLTKKGTLKDFIASGSVKDLEVELLNKLYLEKVSLSFFADKNDTLIKNIFGKFEDIKIDNGDIRLNLENGIKLNSNFNTIINLDEKLFFKYSKLFKNFDLLKNLKTIKADFNNNIFIDLDKTYKIRDYKYSISGKIDKSELELANPIKNILIQEELKKIYLSDLRIKSFFSLNNSSFDGEGKYSLNNLDFLKINFVNNINKNTNNLKINLDYNNNLEIDLINYKKPLNSVASLYIDLNKTKENLKINKFNFEEKKNYIKIDDLEFKGNKFLSFKELKVLTPGNNFVIKKDKKITVKGDKLDAINLAKFFNNNGDKNNFQNINGNIVVELKNIKLPMSEVLQNFRLIGEIQKGRFIKISSKGDFGKNNFLDISMVKGKGNNKKYLEIYSDLTRPLLSEFSFFNGLSGGKLLFTSVIDNSKYSSKLKIENFKVVNAPGLVKLLSLADLSGLADLAEGDGLTFDLLEIEMEKSDNYLELKEILALGPSMSVIMEGYQNKDGLTSLRGTLVPAKTLNKIISKIPVIGNIVIPKEIGEGLFGISFKMKGPKGDIKTMINPIKTLTPRFIQKIVEKNKETK